MQFVRRLDARVVSAVPAQAQHPGRMLLVRRERVEHTIAINNPGTELCVAHLLSKLLAAWLVFAQEMGIPRQFPLQGRQTVGKWQIRGAACDGNILPWRLRTHPFHSVVYSPCMARTISVAMTLPGRLRSPLYGTNI